MRRFYDPIRHYRLNHPTYNRYDGIGFTTDIETEDYIACTYFNSVELCVCDFDWRVI
jgi:hypothetical protein